MCERESQSMGVTMMFDIFAKMMDKRAGRLVSKKVTLLPRRFEIVEIYSPGNS